MVDALAFIPPDDVQHACQPETILADDITRGFKFPDLDYLKGKLFIIYYL